MKAASALISAVLILVLAGCSPQQRIGDSQAEPAVPVKMLHASQQCGGSGDSPSVEVATNAADFKRMLEDLSQGMLSESPVGLPAVSFEDEIVLLIRMGQRPSAGYSLSLDSGSAALRDGDAYLEVSWREPAEGAMTAQVLTRPCLLVAIGRDGYSAVRIIDRQDRVRFRVSIE